MVLNQLLADALEREVDHVLVTGDLVERPTRENLVSAVRVFKRRGLWSPERCTIVPGNHDVSGLPEDPDFGRNQGDRARAAASFARLTAHVDRSVPEAGPPLLHGRPVGKRLGPLELLALSSVSLSDSMGGLLRESDFEALRSFFSGAKKGVRLVALHHNPLPLPRSWAKATGRIEAPPLFDGARLVAECARARVDLILHGHIHTTGRPVDRRSRGVYIRCQATSKGELVGRRRRFGYDVYDLRRDGWRRSRCWLDSAAIVDAALEDQL